MARERNPRRVALEILATVKRRLERARNTFDVDGTVLEHYTTPQERTFSVGNGRYATHMVTSGWRKRRPEEYPENQIPAWVALFNEADAIISEMEKVKQMAAANYRRLKDEQNRAVAR